MSNDEHRNIAYLLEDVMKNKYNRGFYQEDLWEYVENKKIFELNIKDVKHWIYKPCWSYIINNRECFYSIYQVLMQKNKFKEDIKRIKKADTKYPLIIIEDEFDKYGTILDGNHRFAKLLINNSNKVKFKFISRKELDKIIIKF
jgi:disulfide oxidoreductase YuzD